MAVPGQAGHAVRAKQSQADGELVVIRDDHATLPGRHVLVREETETACPPPGPQSLPGQSSTRSVGHVFHDIQTVTFGQRDERREISRVAAIVDDDDRPRARCDTLGH